MTIIVRQIHTWSYVEITFVTVVPLHSRLFYTQISNSLLRIILFKGIPFVTVVPLHSRILSTKIPHSLLRGIPVKGAGIPVSYRNSCNSCSFLAEMKGTSKMELTTQMVGVLVNADHFSLNKMSFRVAKTICIIYSRLLIYIFHLPIMILSDIFIPTGVQLFCPLQ